MIKTSQKIIKGSRETLHEKIAENFRKDGVFILRDSYRTFKIDFIDSSTDKYYVLRNIKDGSYKRIDRNNVVDFTILNVNENDVFCETYLGIDFSRRMALENHIPAILTYLYKKEKAGEIVGNKTLQEK